MIPIQVEKQFIREYQERIYYERCTSVFKELTFSCWVWKTEMHPDKQLMKRYVLDGKRKWFSLPRLAYEIFNNTTIPKEQVIRHLCHNKHCINPYHLKPGTRKENKKDESEVWGIKDNLTEKQVYEIRQKYIPQDFNCIEKLAHEYNVDTKTIWYVVKYKIYKSFK